MSSRQSASECPVAIIVASIHHGNTRRVADAIADELFGRVYTVDEAQQLDVSKCELVGLGSGIYFGQHHQSLRALVASWKELPRSVFLFSTAGLPVLRYFQHAALRRLIRQQSVPVVGEFCCRGWDTVGPLWLMGGINRRHPDAADLARARRFASTLAMKTTGLPQVTKPDGSDFPQIPKCPTGAASST